VQLLAEGAKQQGLLQNSMAQLDKVTCFLCCYYHYLFASKAVILSTAFVLM